MKSAAVYLARRLVWAVILVVGVASMTFFVAHVLPGDPARMLAGAHASPADVEHVRKVYGLDEPLRAQYVAYFQRLVHRGPAVIDRKRDPDHKSCAAAFAGLHVDLGYSFSSRKPVVDLLAAKIPRSIELGVAALFVQLVLGLSLGVAAAARRGGRLDEAAMGLSLAFVSAPTFLLGLLLQYIFAYRLRVLPYDGYGATAADHARSIVLPALTLGVFGSALYARIARDELATLLGQDFIRTARAKGASGARVLFVHALRNALIPIATLAVLELGTLVGGAVVTESLFRWPGVGQATVTALQNRDGPVIVGAVLFTSCAVVLSTIVLDVLYVALDPRLRRGAQG